MLNCPGISAVRLAHLLHHSALCIGQSTQPQCFHCTTWSFIQLIPCKIGVVTCSCMLNFGFGVVTWSIRLCPFPVPLLFCYWSLWFPKSHFISSTFLPAKFTHCCRLMGLPVHMYPAACPGWEGWPGGVHRADCLCLQEEFCPPPPRADVQGLWASLSLGHRGQWHSVL